MKYLLKICLLLVLLVSISPTNPVKAAVLEVRSPSGGIVALDVYPTIQAAIDAASPGDTLIVHAGAYTENIDITKRLILEGDGSGNNPASDTIITASVANHPTVQIQAGGASESQRLIVRNLRVTGATGGGNPGSGIEFDIGSGDYISLENVASVGNGGSGVVTDMIGAMTDIRFIDCNFSDNGNHGVNVNSTDAIDGFTVTDCQMNGNGGGLGMYLEGALTDVNITGGAFTGNGNGTWDDTGIYANHLNDGFATPKPIIIQNLDVSDNPRGLFLNVCGGPSLVIDNVTSNNNDTVNAYEIGAISVYSNMYGGACGSLGSLQIKNSTANNAVNPGIMIKATGAVDNIVINNVQLSGNKTGVYMKDYGGTITDATISDCNITNNITGIQLVGTPTGVNIVDNDILNNGPATGILIESGAAAGSEAHNNCIAGNGFGVNNLDANDFDATLNSWGDPTGPYHPLTNTGGLGDQVSDNVAYYPWYVDCSFTTLIDKPVHNVTINAYYDFIQDAIDEASADDVIVVLDDLVEDGQVVVDKDLTIKGNSKHTIMTNQDTGTSGNARAWFLVNAGVELTLQDLILDGSGYNVYQGVRILGHGTINDVDFKNITYLSIYNGMAVAAMGDGPVDVNGCTFENIGRIGVIYFGSGVNGSVYSNNTYTGKGPGDWLDYGVELGGGAKAEVKDSTMTDCNGIASSDGSTSAGILVTTYYGAGTEATINSCTLTNNSSGIAAGYDEDDTSVVVARCNTIAGNIDYGIVAVEDAVGLSVDAEKNWWGSASGPSGEGGGTGDAVSANVDFFPWLLSLDGCEDYTVVVADIVVDDDWAGLPDWTTVTVGGTDYYIGLNAFATIQEALDVVAEGQVISVQSGSYPEDLTIDTNDVEIVAAGTTIKGVGTLPWSSWPVALPNINILADGVSIHGFTIESPDIPDGKYSSGIVIGGSNVEIYDNDFVMISVGDAGDPGGGVCIQTYRDDNLGYENDIAGLNVHDNTFSGTPGGGYVGVFINHTIPTDGIVTIKGNAFSGNLAYPVWTERYNTDIIGNQMAGSTEFGSWYGIVVRDYDNRQISDVNIICNTITGFGTGMIFGDAGHAQTFSNINVQHNTIQSNSVGVLVRADAQDINLNYNNISGNDANGVENTNDSALNALNNWWGSASGPSGEGPGSGDGISELVNYNPWLTVPISVSDCPSACPEGDLDYDCDVDFVDLAILANNWLVGTEE